jgi:hypothetical protein
MVACLVWCGVDIAFNITANFRDRTRQKIVPSAVFPDVTADVPDKEEGVTEKIDDTTYAMMKKGDTMPRHTSSSVPPNPNHHQWSSLFLGDDIRQSLRQRGPLPT